jgi:hypothetical protein
MVRFKLLPVLFILASMASCASLCAQTVSDQPKHVWVLPAPVDVGLEGKSVKQLPEPGLVPRGIPFAVDSGSMDFARSIRVVPAAEMSRHDRDLAADAESSIQERAGYENLGFNEGGWNYSQLVCPALPNHLFLRFTRNDGARDMSMFSAAIPRSGEGRLRIIPIVRKGYSLFSPAPIGALTIAAFNRIRVEENSNAPADWVGTGLCYAALAGANPLAGQVQSGSGASGDMPITFPPTLMVTNQGVAIIRFADLSATPRPMEWDMIFDRKGKLVKATHSPAYLNRYSAHPIRTLDVSEVNASGKQQ